MNNPSPYGPAPWVSGAPQSRGTGREGVGEVVVTGSRIAAPPPAPAAGEEPLQITLAPPLEELDETACVVYALAG